MNRVRNARRVDYEICNMDMNEKTQAAVIAMGVLGAKYVKRTPAHVYFEIPRAWGKEKVTRAAKEFIRQTGIGVKVKLV